MKTLVAPRAMKSGIDQIEQAGSTYPTQYIPLENHQTWTGMGISPQAAQNYIAVYQCIRVLSNTFGMLPLKLYRRRADGGKEEATDHPLYRVLHLQPNPDMTSFVWRKVAMQHISTWGNHYSEITHNALGEMQLWPMRPDRIEVRWGKDGRKQYSYLSSMGTRKDLRPGSVFHMQGQNTDGLIGTSPITDLRTTLSLSGSAERYGSSVFDNGARPAVIMSHPGNLSDPAIKRLAGQMDDLRGSRNAGKTVILEEGLTVTPVGFPPEDAQFLGTRLNQHRLVYGAFGIPPHKVGDLERATFSNIEHQSLEFIQDGIMPWLVNAEQEYAVQIIDEDDIFAEFSVDGYLRGDAESRAKALAIRWQHGTLNADAWRKLENENPLPDGLGQHYYVPENYKRSSEDDEVAVPAVELQSPPQLVAVKSAEVRCVSCNRKLAELAAPPYRITCGRCKTVTEATGAEAEPTKSAGEMFLEMMDSLPSRIAAAIPRAEPVPAPEVHFHEGAFRAGDVTVAAPDPAVVNVNVPKSDPSVVNVTIPEPKPVRRTVERDANDKIIAFTDAG